MQASLTFLLFGAVHIRQVKQIRGLYCAQYSCKLFSSMDACEIQFWQQTNVGRSRFIVRSHVDNCAMGTYVTLRCGIHG